MNKEQDESDWLNSFSSVMWRDSLMLTIYMIYIYTIYTITIYIANDKNSVSKTRVLP